MVLNSYPLNLFFNYVEDIPDGVRISTPEDCEKCIVKQCDVTHCLIGVYND